MHAALSATIGFVANGLDVSMHRHAAVQLVFALDRPFDTRIHGALHAQIEGFVVDSDTPHECRAYGGRLVIVNLAPFSGVAQALRGAQLTAGAARVFERMPAASMLSDALHVEQQCQLQIDTLTQGAARLRTDLDPRVQALVEAIARDADTPMTISKLAREVHLSPSRLATLFRRQTGVPVMRYAQWARLAHAARQILTPGCGGLTQIAVDAGYHDLPHLHRAMRAMFGIAPRALAENSHLIQAIQPEVR
jgi:AraC-like DNA-binding protein